MVYTKYSITCNMFFCSGSIMDSHTIIMWICLVNYKYMYKHLESNYGLSYYQVKLLQSKGLSQRTLRKLPGITNNEQLQNLNPRFEYNYFTSKLCKIIWRIQLWITTQFFQLKICHNIRHLEFYWQLCHSFKRHGDLSFTHFNFLNSCAKLIIHSVQYIV